MADKQDASMHGNPEEKWHLLPPEVVRPKRIPWLLVPFVSLFVPLFPRTLGPHIAQASWGAAFFVGALHGSFIIGHWLMAETVPAWSDLAAPFDLLRAAYAKIVLVLLMGDPQLPWNLTAPPAATIAMLIGAVIAGSTLLTAPLIWALHSVGEQRRLLFARALKLGLWNTASATWLVLILIPWLGNRTDYAVLDWTVVLLLHLTIVARLGARYSGPRTGPRWEPIEPYCEGCRYSLIGIPPDGNCPECARPVAHSHPDHRHPPAFATARGLRRVPGFFATLRDSMFNQEFARHLSLWRARRASDHYMIIVCILCGLATTALVAVLRFAHGEQDSPFLSNVRLGHSGDWLLPGLVVGLACYLMGVGERFTQSIFFGRRSVPNAVLLNYLYGWVLAIVTLGGIGLVVADVIVSAVTRASANDHTSPSPDASPHVTTIPGLGPIPIGVLIYLACTIIPLLPLIYAGIRQTFRQIREIRYACG